LIEEQGVAIPPEAITALEQLDASGQTSLLVARDGIVLGALGARDTLRPEAAQVLADLRALGIAPVALLTGDRAAVARAVAEQLPVTETHAELLPAQKASIVGSGQWTVGREASRGEPPSTETPLAEPSEVERSSERPTARSSLTTAFVGDGINDAPALARAGVGIAIGGGRGTDVAAEAGDIVMMGEPLRPLPLLVKLSRETVRIIRQNIIVFAFGVNLVGVALTGWLWPLFSSSPEWYESAPLAGVIYHQLGSLAVLLNSMRLLAFDRIESRTLARVRGASQAVEGWFSRFSLDELLHALLHRWKVVCGAIAGAVVIGWGFTCFAQIENGEVGVVRRFGEVTTDLQPGLHVRWPWPVETVTRVRPGDVRTVELGFRVVADAQGTKGGAESNTWTSGHGDGIGRLTDEAVMITGDGDLVEILATVRYRVSDPRKYLFAASNPDGIVRSSAESVLRELVASYRFLELLTVRRAELERAALDRLNRRLAEAAPDGLGVELNGFTLHDLHPPPEVVKSYHDVAKAIQERDKVINDATADALRMYRRAEEVADHMRKLAGADAHARLESARADRDSFLAWHLARSKLTDAEESALAAERAKRVGAGQDVATVDKDIAAYRAKVLAARRALIEARLTYQTLVDVLRARDKVLIDAADIPVRRNLLLTDPDLLRFPPIMGLPKEKEP
jgi:Cu+-exporting ATPase